jgi:hypothetical protein
LKLLILGLGPLLALAVACGGDDDGSSGNTQPSGSSGSAAATEAPGGDGAAPTQAPVGSGGGASSGGGGGTVTIGDEVIVLERALCYLQEQEVAGSPGKILLSGAGFGQLASGEEIVLDVTRYDEDSLFTGDDIEVEVGDPFGDDYYSWIASGDLGTINVDGSTLSVDELTFRHSQDDTEKSGSFVLNC